MSDPKAGFDMPGEDIKESKPFPWAILIAAALLIGGGIAWIMASKAGNEKAAAIAALDKELTADEAALQAQKDKVVQITQQLEAMKLDIQTGKVKDKKKAVDDYNALAKQQNTERDKYQSMGTAYNAKVAKYKDAQ